ncbi:MAG: hypothetical protein COB53_06525 [Elusimicrobia bacterium]|nr:MAG: hypothetical protein COB53_06525 [Elusimicrobiota bacterium]
MSNALGSTLILLGVNLLAGTAAHFGFDRLLFGNVLQGSAQAVYCRSIWIALLIASQLFFSIFMSFGESENKERRNAFLFWAGIGIWFVWGLAFHRSTLKPLILADAGAFFIFANAAIGALAQKHGIAMVNCWESFKDKNTGASASIDAIEDGLRGAAEAAAEKRQNLARD